MWDFSLTKDKHQTCMDRHVGRLGQLKRVPGAKLFSDALEDNLKANGFCRLKSEYLIGKNERFFNRSNSATSNFFVLMKEGPGKVTVLFTNPRDDRAAGNLEPREVVLRHAYGGEGQPLAVADRITAEVLGMSRQKPEHKYYIRTHGHWGTVNGECVWDDGVSADRAIIRQLVLWNYDIDMSGYHNWFKPEQNAFLKRRMKEVGIVKVPAFELTIPVLKPTDYTGMEPMINGPHYMVYCATSRIATELRDELLARKLVTRGSGIPASGPPVETSEAFRILNRYRTREELAVAVAHPASALPGLGVYNQVALGRISLDEANEIFRTSNGMERYNLSLEHMEMNFDLSDGVPDSHSEVAEKLRGEMRRTNVPGVLTPAMLNYWTSAKRWRDHYPLTGHDDHHQHGIPWLTGRIGSLGQGHTKFSIPRDSFEKLQAERRKPSPREIVHAFNTGRLPGSKEPVYIDAIAFARMTEKGPAVVKNRQPAFSERVEDVILRIAQGVRLVYFILFGKRKERITRKI